MSDLAKALEAHKRLEAPPPASPRSLGPPPQPPGPRTQMAIRVMAWVFGLFWVFWISAVLSTAAPKDIEGLAVVPFSAAVTWLIFQFHRQVLVRSVRRLAPRRMENTGT